MLHSLITFSASKFSFLNKNSNNKYSVFLIGTDLSEERLKIGLKTFDSSRDTKALTHFFNEEKVISIGLLESKAIPIFGEEIQTFQKKIDFRKSHFAVLLQYEDPAIFRGVFIFPAEESFLGILRCEHEVPRLVGPSSFS